MSEQTPTQSTSQSKDVPCFFYTKDRVKRKNVEIGDYTYGIPTIRWLQGEDRVVIGKFCSIAAGVEILAGGNHRVDWTSTYPFPRLKSDWPLAEGETPVSKGSVIIGNDVWIGYQSVILSGVTIGDGAVISARAVVTKDVAPYAMVAGNPAVEVKKRFDEKTIEKLLEVKWWDWDDEKIRRNVALLCHSPDIEKIMECI